MGVGYNDKIFHNTNCKKGKDVLYVGKVSLEKGVKCLVKAFAKCNFENDVVLDIVGSASDKKEYNDILKESKKSINKIRFLGSKNQIELSKIYNSHDVFILPSFNEGMPLVILEAISCNDKVIVTSLSGIREFIKNNTSDAIVSYIKLPDFNNKKNIDKELFRFTNEVTKNLEKMLAINRTKSAKVFASWDSVAKKILNKK